MPMHPFSKLLRFLSIIILIIISFSVLSCNEVKKETKPSEHEKVVLKQSFREKVRIENEDYFLLLENTCLYCHKVKNFTVEDPAPSLQVIRDVYKRAFPTKEDFVEAFVEFTVDPSIEKSIMKSAIDQYGLMEDAGHTKDDVEDIADYLFDYQF